MSVERWAEAVWYGTRPRDAIARMALAPASAAFAAAVRVRGRLYDAGRLRQHALPLTAVSVGNLTVGGTGKTPVAAWIVAELAARGLHPAVVLRGVGNDEARVHALLNPTAPVVADPDRVRGAGEALRLGADVLVLDDAFQHRRAARDADVVLVASETFADRAQLLPAGPFREPLGALRRASVVVVTRKSGTLAQAERVATDLARPLAGTKVGITVAHLAPAELVRWSAGHETEGQGGDPMRAAVAALGATRVLAVAGIGAPDAFAAQLRAAGADVVLARFADHHAYDDTDVAELVRSAERVDRVVTTLKDAVKLGPRWPRRAPALWYVTQRVTLETGAPALVDVLDAVATAARTAIGHAPHRSVPESAVHGRQA